MGMAEMSLELDKGNAVLMGVCAGFARWADVDSLLVRVTLVLTALFFAPIAIPAYLLAASMLKPSDASSPPLLNARTAGWRSR